MESVGVRELRQNASALLDRVMSSGESIQITNHGRPVALLTPITQRANASRDALIDAGVLHPGRGDLLEVHAISAPPGTPPTADLLDADRNDR